MGKIRKQSSFVHLKPTRQDELGNAPHMVRVPYAYQMSIMRTNEYHKFLCVQYKYAYDCVPMRTV